MNQRNVEKKHIFEKLEKIGINLDNIHTIMEDFDMFHQLLIGILRVENPQGGEDPRMSRLQTQPLLHQLD